MSCFRIVPISGFRFPGFRFLVSGFRSPFSDFRFPISGFWFTLSSLRFPISDFRLPIYVFRVCGFRSPVSSFRFPFPVSGFLLPFSDFCYALSEKQWRVESASAHSDKQDEILFLVRRRWSKLFRILDTFCCCCCHYWLVWMFSCKVIHIY